HRKFDGADSYGTDVIYYRNSRWVNPIINDPDNPAKTLRRTTLVTELANPTDIDGDGIIEICSSAGEFPGYREVSSFDKLRPVIWRTVEGNKLVNKYTSYYSEKYDYVFFLPARWEIDITAAVSLEENTIDFCKAGASVSDSNELILSIKTVFENEEFNPDGWTFFKQGENNRFSYYIKSAAPENILALTAEELEYAFRILSEIIIN
ncbi:MAG: hypothetical protein FWG44_08265, partial [Oscillospiraceae bacterium]|nr:hypothetical protein [Oscillospiraceae bacterium]